MLLYGQFLKTDLLWLKNHAKESEDEENDWYCRKTGVEICRRVVHMYRKVEVGVFEPFLPEPLKFAGAGTMITFSKLYCPNCGGYSSPKQVTKKSLVLVERPHKE